MSVAARTEQSTGARDRFARRQRFPSQGACAGAVPRRHRHLRELMDGLTFYDTRAPGRASLTQHELREPGERVRSGEQARMSSHAAESGRIWIVDQTRDW